MYRPAVITPEVAAKFPARSRLECESDAVLDAEQGHRVDEDGGLVDTAGMRDSGSGIGGRTRLRDRGERNERDQESRQKCANH
jgi:hypothetical protein